jgi:dCMP deaminase
MQDKWNNRFMDLAFHVASWSRDPSTKVGALIVDYEHNVRAMGYNGFPRGIADTDERLNNRELKYPLTVHAERNALASCAKLGIRTDGCYLVCTHYPCSVCAGIIIQSGIMRVIVKKPDEAFLGRWEDTQLALDMFAEANVAIEIVNQE